MAEQVSTGSRDAPPVRAISDEKATLLACGCLLCILAADGVVTGVLAYLLLRWFGWLD